MLHLVLFFLISIAYVKPEKAYISVDAERRPFLFKTFLACVDKTNADSTTMQKVMDWKFEDDESVKKYMYCFSIDTGLSDSNGELVKDKILNLFKNSEYKDQVSNVIDECKKLKGKDKYDNIFKKASCFYKESPVLFKI